MSNSSEVPAPHENRGRTARKLVYAAALAASLIPLGAVAVDAATINCITSEESGSGSGGCFGVTGSYVASGGAEVSNIWKFFADEGLTELIYTFEIAGVPENDFELDVIDVVTTQNSLLDGPALTNFPNSVCIPTFDTGLCGLFDVFHDGDPTWDEDGYYVTITWFSNLDPLSQPPDDGRNYILQAKDELGGTIFTNQLTDTLYEPNPTPTDPALGGRGNSFSRFGGFRTAPEPSTLLLLGCGLLTALSRRRRRSSQD